MTTVYTSAPRKYLLGTKDESTRSIPVEDVAIPTHLPYMPFLAEKGPSYPVLSRKGAAIKYFGSRSFEENNEYATHQTPFINKALENGNTVMLHRILPDGAKTALLRISAEVIKATLPMYERTDDGTIKYTFDEYDQRVPVIVEGETVVGNRLVFHIDVIDGQPPEPVDGAVAFGRAEVIDSYRNGSVAAIGNPELTLGDVGSQSTRYPIMDLLVADPGGYGDRLGLRIQLPTSKSINPLDTASFYANMAYILRLGLVEKSRIDGSITQLETQLGELFIDVALKEGAKADRTGFDLDIDTKFVKSYREQSDDQVLQFAAPFDKIHVYRTELEVLMKRLIAGEATYNDEREGFGSVALTPDNPYAVNFFGGYDENGVPYYSIDTTHSASFGGVAMSSDTTVFASGGDDGLPRLSTGEFDTLAIYELYDRSVRRIAETFGTNPIVRFQNYAKYPMSAIWDSGFSLSTKKALLNIFTYRKDVAVILSTYALADYKTALVDSQVTKVWSWMEDLTVEEELSVAATLRAFASLYPESETFGTPVCRAQIVGYSGRIINTNFSRRVPVTYEYLDKVTRFMGRASGVWDGERAYDVRGNNLVTNMTDISITWLLENVANQAWARGLVYVEDYDTRSLFFPGIRTVYNDETSVLNSSITMWAICHIERVCHMAWRDLTGNSKWSPNKFLEESDRIIEARLANVFDDRFRIVVETFYTEADVRRGYSWSTRVHIYANNMRTVGQYTVVAHRMEDYQATNV